VGLRRFELGLFGFLRSLVFGEQILDLRRRGVVIQRLLQGILFRAGLAAETAASAAGTALAAVLSTTIAAKHATAGAADITARVHDVLDERLHPAPVRVVGEIEVLTDGVHHHLLPLPRGHVLKTAATAAGAAGTPLPIAPLSAVGLAAVVIAVVLLRENIAGAQGQRGRDRA